MDNAIEGKWMNVLKRMFFRKTSLWTRLNLWLLFLAQKSAVPHTAKVYIPLKVVATITAEIKSSTISWFKILPEHWLWTWICDPTWLCKKKLLKFPVSDDVFSRWGLLIALFVIGLSLSVKSHVLLHIMSG